MAASRWLVNWKYKIQCSNLMYFRNVRYTDIPKISVLKPILVRVFQSYRYTEISNISEFFGIPYQIYTPCIWRNHQFLFYSNAK
jgi:hypothetical protein